VVASPKIEKAGKGCVLVGFLVFKGRKLCHSIRPPFLHLAPHDFDDDDDPANQIDLAYLTGDAAAQAAADAAAQDARDALAASVATKRLHSLYRSDPQVPFSALANSDGPITKRIFRDGGKLKSDGSRCCMTEGSAHRAGMGFPHEFADFIRTMGDREAIVLGSLNPGLDDCCHVVTKPRLASLNGSAPRDLIARTQDYFSYQPGQPAMVLIDVDTKSISPVARLRMAVLGGPRKALACAVPALAEAAAVVRQSTSSGISCTETGECYPDSGGLHWYVRAMIEQTDTPKTILNRMHQRAWLAGLGWGWVDQVGKVHSRSLVDPVVANAERLVFEAAPELEDGLEQDPMRRKPIAIEGRTLTLDDFPELRPDELETVQRMVEAERIRLKPDSAEAETVYVEARKRVIQASKPEMTAAEALRAAITELKSIQNGKLEADCVLVFDGMGAVTVADILAGPETYVGRACADPIEGPDYGRQTAMLLRNRNDNNLWIRSHAHGGQNFDLPDESTEAQAQAEPDPEPDLDPPAADSFFHTNVADLNFDAIPPTPWLHGERLLRGQVSVLTGGGGIGKTALTTTVAVSLASGINLIDPSNTNPRWMLHEPEPINVFLYNLEDDITESTRRLKAVLLHHKIDKAALMRRLEVGDGTVKRLVVAIADKKTGLVERQACVERLIAWLIEHRIDAVIFDPLVKAHKVGENDNNHMDAVMTIFKEVAIRANCAVWIVHHSSKAGTTMDSNGSRGASAVPDAARVCETMTKPTAEDRTKYALDDSYVRLDATKANLSEANINTMWFRIDGVCLGNATAKYPKGDYRQALTLIQPQAQTERMDRALFDLICTKLRERTPQMPNWGRARQNKKLGWVGLPIIEAGLKEGDAKLLVKEWEANGQGYRIWNCVPH